MVDTVENLKEAQIDQREARTDDLREIRQQLEYAHNNNELLTEALAELEIAMEDVGWQRIAGLGDREFSISGLRQLRRLARFMFLKNPLIKHAVLVQSHYVWGQGVTVSATNDKINEVAQAFLEDPKNINVFTGHQARLQQETEVQVEGDKFLALFTNKSTGRVIVRQINADEVVDIVTNPEDYQEPWFYKRQWVSRHFDVDSGEQTTRERTTYYPDWRLTYNADKEIPRPDKINGNDVLWDAPVYHIKAGGFSDQRFGCPEIYAAMDWARAVKEDLEDYATLRRAHARFAWKLSTPGGKYGVSAAKSKLGTTLSSDGAGMPEQNPPPGTGSTYIQARNNGKDVVDLTPMKTAGMVPSPEEGRRMWLMVSAATGIPETILSGNADVGNLATAKTLDRPTELQMENRRQFWVDINLDILNYVIDMAIKCPNGMLHKIGKKVTDTSTDLISYELLNGEDRELEIRFPSILRHDIFPLIQAIAWAITLDGKPSAGLIDDKTGASMLLSALGENDYDDIIAAMFPNDAFTFNAGLEPPPGATDSEGNPIPRPTRFPQSVQSGTDAGQGDMGDATPAGRSIPTDAYFANMFGEAAKRLHESVGAYKTRSSKNRSGVKVVKRNKRVPTKKESTEVAIK